ncbi:MAG: 50S ribosomal protein L25, partial [Pseudomonadota bacterium]
VELSCPAEAIPEGLEADLAGLDIGGSVHISDITLPEGVEPTITDRDFTIATIAAAMAEEVEPTDEDEEFEGLEGAEGAEEGEAAEGEEEGGGEE